MAAPAPPAPPVSSNGTPVFSPFEGKAELVEVNVNVGDAVTAGQVVAAVEAMKAKHDVRAPRSGRVATIEVVSESAAEARLWATLREVCELFEGLEWVLVGGLMVKTLEAEHGRVMPVTTIDVDAIIDVRAMLRGQG